MAEPVAAVCPKCIWCGRPEEDHGPPELQVDARPTTAIGRLCPVPGVTSQYFTPPYVAPPTDAEKIAALTAEVEGSNKLLTQAVDLLHIVAEYGGTGPDYSAISFAELATRIEHHLEKGTDHAG